jgi:hypothetical protein
MPLGMLRATGKVRAMKQYGRILMVSGAWLAGCGVLWAQAPPGPMGPPPAGSVATMPDPPKKKEVAARKNIFGAWRFDKDDSDDPRGRQSQDSGHSNGGGGYGGPRIGFPGGGPGSGGPYGGQRRNPQDDTSERLGDQVNPVRELQMLQHDQNDPEVEMYDDRSHRHIFYTDGRKIDKQKDPTLEEVSARWDGSRLVTDEKAPHNGKMSRTFEVSSDGHQLLETVRVTDSKGNHPITVNYVYDAVEKSDLSFPPH